VAPGEGSSPARPEDAALRAAEAGLAKAKASKRDEAWSALEEFGASGLPFARRALETRWSAAVQAVAKSSTLKRLEKLAQDRTELDFRRECALELIFDEDRYFYPYRPPECPPEKARGYWPVQQRVDELVENLRDAWEDPRTVKLSSNFRAELAELRWCRARAAQVELTLELPEGLVPWVLFVPTETKTLDLHGFVWNAEEARQLANDRAVLAFNRLRWKREAQARGPQQEHAHAEQERQVQITNEYRRMFGRRILAWSPRLQAATLGHSDYMARTGDFGHFEKGDDERKTPFDRMRLVGYNYGVSENCYMGGGSAQSAHDAWRKSSGHHRNLLMPGHTQMAAAFNSGYWTQNFGADKEFRSEIDTWQD